MSPGNVASRCEHYEVLEDGAASESIVRRYLVALLTHEPRRQSNLTPASIGRKIADTESSLRGASTIQRLKLVQKRNELRGQLAALGEPDAVVAALEEDFVRVAKGYSEDKDVPYNTWRDAGVAATVLGRAGITGPAT